MKQDLFKQQLSGAVNGYTGLYEKVKGMHDILLEAIIKRGYFSRKSRKEFHALHDKCEKMLPQIIPYFVRLLNTHLIKDYERWSLLAVMLSKVEKYSYTEDLVDPINNIFTVDEDSIDYKALNSANGSKLGLSIAVYTLLRCLGADKIPSPLLLPSELLYLERKMQKSQIENLRKEVDEVFNHNLILIFSPVTVYRIGPSLLEEYLRACSKDVRKLALTEILTSELNNQKSNDWLNNNYHDLIEECVVTGVDRR